MPVLCVFAPSAEDIELRLSEACRTAAAALGLAEGDVIAVHVPTSCTVRPGHPGTQWPVLVVHGAPREPDVMGAAVDALRHLAQEWSDGEAWVTWQAPQ